MVSPQTTQTAAILDRTAVQLALFTLHDPRGLCHYRALAAAGRNNYIPPAQESSLILPDGFSVGISGWSRDYLRLSSKRVRQIEIRVRGGRIFFLDEV